MPLKMASPFQLEMVKKKKKRKENVERNKIKSLIFLCKRRASVLVIPCFRVPRNQRVFYKEIEEIKNEVIFRVFNGQKLEKKGKLTIVLYLVLVKNHKYNKMI
jgi:hypothetical protein